MYTYYKLQRVGCYNRGLFVALKSDTRVRCATYKTHKLNGTCLCDARFIIDIDNYAHEIVRRPECTHITD
jgi:hypothetical protein